MSMLRRTAAAVMVWLSACSRSPSPLVEQPNDTAVDPSAIVVVHSWTGRTAMAGRQIASMMGAKMLLATSGPAAAPSMDQLTGELANGKVHRLYLGFPVWDEAPSPPAQQFIENADLSGITVIPFYTYLHYIDPSTLERFAETIRARGGTPVEALGLRIPLSYTEAQIDCVTRRTVLDHPAAWPGAREGSPAARCGPDATGERLCAVPAGWVWLGDTSPDCVGPSPRAMRVDGFSIMQMEVTVAEYSRCIEAWKCPQAQTLSRISSKLIASGDPSLPIFGISYAAARAYCAWRDMRLPTEAEWIRAGRDYGTEPYPWGSQLDTTPLRGNFGDRPGMGLPHYSFAPPDWPADGVAGLARGCSFPAGNSPFGLCDLAGNLAEWVTRVDDPDGDQPVQTLKGGSWLDAEPMGLRLSSRIEMPTAMGGFYLSGFRCARSDPGRE